MWLSCVYMDVYVFLSFFLDVEDLCKNPTTITKTSNFRNRNYRTGLNVHLETNIVIIRSSQDDGNGQEDVRENVGGIERKKINDQKLTNVYEHTYIHSQT